jgi:hypothetical protein
MRYLHDTSVSLKKDDALLIAQHLIQEALEGDEVSLNLCLKYPDQQGEAPRLTLNTSLLSIGGMKITWGMIEGREIWDTEETNQQERESV